MKKIKKNLSQALVIVDTGYTTLGNTLTANKEGDEENLFPGNFDLRLPISLKSLKLRYVQEKEEGLDQGLMISKLQETKRCSEICEEDFHRYLKRLIKKEQSRMPVKNKGLSVSTKSTAADPKRLT